LFGEYLSCGTGENLAGVNPNLPESVLPPEFRFSQDLFKEKIILLNIRGAK